MKLRKKLRVSFDSTSSVLFHATDPPILLAEKKEGATSLVDALLKERRRQKRGIHSQLYDPLATIGPLIYDTTSFHLPSHLSPQDSSLPSCLAGVHTSSPSSPPTAHTPNTKKNCRHAPIKPIAHAGNLRTDRLLSHLNLPEGDGDNMKKVFKVLTSGKFFREHVLRPGPPPPSDRPPARSSALSDKDKEDLIKWKVVARVSRREWKRLLGFAFKVWKADGITARFILDCFRLNDWSTPPPAFRIAQPREVALLLASSPFAWSVDMKNWFFQFALPEAIRLYFAFRVDTSILSMLVLAMGWCWAPFLAHSVTCGLSGTPALSFSSKSPAAVIIDNSLVVAKSFLDLVIRKEAFERRADSVDAVIGDKDDLALTKGTRVLHGGVRYWTLPKLIWALKDTVARRIANDILISTHSAARLTWQRWRSVLGSVVWATRVLEVPLVCIAGAWDWAAFLDKQNTPLEDTVRLWDSASGALRALALWLKGDPHMQWQARRPTRCFLWTDASKKGWGAVLWHPSLGWRSARGWWTGNALVLADISMPWAETAALGRAFKWMTASHPRLLSSTETHWIGDCFPSVCAMASGRSSSTRMGSAVRNTFRRLLLGKGSLSCTWAPTNLQLADGPSRGRAFSLSSIAHPIFIPLQASWWFPMALPSSSPHPSSPPTTFPPVSSFSATSGYVSLFT
jgi:hypothetical protein